MTDAVIRMHLVQALTRTTQSSVRTHLRAALDHWDTSTDAHDEYPNSVPLSHIERAEATLETWLVNHADAGVPELVLVGLLRDYADHIAELCHVPRSWGTATTDHTTSTAKHRSNRDSPRRDPSGGSPDDATR
jgi:hypothetical protein